NDLGTQKVSQLTFSSMNYRIPGVSEDRGADRTDRPARFDADLYACPEQRPEVRRTYRADLGVRCHFPRSTSPSPTSGGPETTRTNRTTKCLRHRFVIAVRSVAEIHAGPRRARAFDGDAALQTSVIGS